MELAVKQKAKKIIKEFKNKSILEILPEINTGINTKRFLTQCFILITSNIDPIIYLLYL